MSPSVDTRTPWFRSLTVSDGIRAAAGREPTKIALSCGDNKLTYGQLVNRMDRVATARHRRAGSPQGRPRGNSRA